MDIVVIPSTPDHVRELALCLREGDRRENEVYGFPSNKVLWRSFKGSLMRKTAFVDGDIAAMWGCGGVPMGTIGQPFLMTSDACERISPLRFARIYQREVHKMLQIFPRLVNYCDAEYHKAMRLLDIIGFKIGEPEPFGMNGAKFCKFEMTA